MDYAIFAAGILEFNQATLQTSTDWFDNQMKESLDGINSL